MNCDVNTFSEDDLYPLTIMSKKKKKYVGELPERIEVSIPDLGSSLC